MQVTIASFSKQEQSENTWANLPSPMDVTLGDNPSLPGIVAATFHWEAIIVTCTGIQNLKLAACRRGKHIVLIPHFSYGPYVKKETAEAILHSLKTMGYRCEWRHTKIISEHYYSEKVSSILNLEPNEELEFNRLSSGVKHKIRKSEANGILVVKGRQELLDDFYILYSKRMHQLGSPALPIKWFANLLAQYQHGEASIWCALMEEKVIGVAFMLEYHGFYEACWVATHCSYNKYYSSYALYWHMIQYAIEQYGIRFSFGRSTKGGSVHSFKQQWGTTDIPLYWNHTHSLKTDLRKLTSFTALWKLLPYSIAQWLGGWFAAKIY